MLRALFLTLFCSLFVVSGFGFRAKAADSTPLQRYDVFELELQGNAYLNPYTDAPATKVTFTGPNGVVIRTAAFWNGGTEWLARVAPPVAGQWAYSVASSDPLLNGVSGSFTVGSGFGGLRSHGLLEVDPLRPHKFRYSDGTPFWFMGHSIDWHRQAGFASGQFREIVEARAQQGFTVLVSYAGPGIGKFKFSANENGPPFFSKNLDRLNPDHFKEVDERLRVAVENGFAVTVALSFADQGIWNMDARKLSKAWRYVVARYAAYPVFWQPIGEYDEGSTSRARGIGQITDILDPYNQPQSMHARTTSAPFAGESWFDFIIHQTSDRDGRVDLVQSEYARNLPIVQEEHRVTDPADVREAAWRHFVNGGYYTLTMANFVITDARTDYMKHLAGFVSGTSFEELEPHSELVDRGECVADPGKEYVVYLSSGGSVQIDLSDTTEQLKVDWYNPRDGSTLDGGTVTGGSTLTFNAPGGQDWALHIHRSADTADAVPTSAPTPPTAN